VACCLAVTLYWSPDEPSRIDTDWDMIDDLLAWIGAEMEYTVGKAEDDAQEESRKRGEELIEALKRDVEQNKKK